jgi:hypothetical protein
MTEENHTTIYTPVNMFSQILLLITKDKLMSLRYKLEFIAEINSAKLFYYLIAVLCLTIRRTLRH